MFKKCLCLNLFVLFIIKVESTLIQYEEMCGNLNGRHIYVELGKKGTITGGNNNNILPLNQQIQNFKIYNQCKLELITCPSCIINVKFLFLNIPQNCSNHTADSCDCEHLLIYEPPYDEISGKQFCGQHTNNDNNSLVFYKSITKVVEIVYYAKNSSEHGFLLEYSSERNRAVIQGYPGQKDISGTQIISTPYFPHRYASDLNIEYIIQCRVNSNCRISLQFTDFLIAKSSVIEIFDSNGKRLEVATGILFRPFTVISSGPSIVIRFYANGAINEGFKASYSFLTADDSNFTLKTNMNCGGLVDNLAGGITMMDLVKDSIEPFDCVWILRPSKSFLHFYTHLYLKVIAFSDFVGKAELWIHEGITSSGEKLEALVYPSLGRHDAKYNEHVLVISKGFYIRFKGLVQAESKLALAYTAFSHNECIIGTDFFCKNLRCIPIYLQCDGFDHCGDNSDEPVSCFQDLKHRRWSHTSNFFFPKNSQYTDIHIAAIIFLVCCFGLVSLIVALIILIYRVNGRVHQQRQMESHLQVITDMLDEDTNSVQEEIIEDDPPEYDPPPTYEELTNGKFQTRFGNKKEEDNRKTPIRRAACSRCSKRFHITLKEDSVDNTIASTSGTTDVPNSPPPNYNDLNYNIIGESSGIKSMSKSTRYSINIKNITESKQSFFARHFSNDDFNILKKKVLQKSKRRKNRNKIISAYDCESNLNCCLSDSELSEINSVNDSIEENSLLKLQRSFSFDDYL